MWVFINKEKIGIDQKLKKVETYGNLKLLVQENELYLNNKFVAMDHWQVRRFLKKYKNFYEDENIYIKKITLKKSKRNS